MGSMFRKILCFIGYHSFVYKLKFTHWEGDTHVTEPLNDELFNKNAKCRYCGISR